MLAGQLWNCAAATCSVQWPPARFWFERSRHLCAAPLPVNPCTPNPAPLTRPPGCLAPPSRTCTAPLTCPVPRGRPCSPTLGRPTGRWAVTSLLHILVFSKLLPVVPAAVGLCRCRPLLTWLLKPCTPCSAPQAVRVGVAPCFSMTSLKRVSAWRQLDACMTSVHTSC